MQLTSLKLIVKTIILTGLPTLLFSGCFMETVVPISPVKQASYPADIIDLWAMLHNKNVVHLIEKLNKNQLKITFLNRNENKPSDSIYFSHISHLDGQMFINNKPKFSNHYEIYKVERPCPDLILIYLPNPELIEKDIKSGRLKGEIKQDFFTFRIIQETQENLVKYIKKNQDELFVPFKYMVRQSQAGKLSNACKSKIKPLPGENKG